MKLKLSFKYKIDGPKFQQMKQTSIHWKHTCNFGNKFQLGD